MALLLTKVLTNPAEGVPAAIEARRALWPVVLLSLSTAFAGACFAVRWNAAPSIIKGLEDSGQLKGMPEADLLDQIQQAERLKLVTSIAGGLILPALTVLGIAVVLALLAWLLGKKGPFNAFFTAAAVGLLPLALARFLYGLVALVQTSLSEDRAATLLPSSLAFVIHSQSPKLMRLLSSLDFFHLWAALLVGVGFAAVVGMRRRQGLLVGALLFVAQLGVFGIGLPALAGGGGR
jgi:Yip1 domain